MVSFSPDGQRFATAGNNGAVSIWNLEGHQLTKVIKGQRETLSSMTLSLRQTQIKNVSFSPDWQCIATVGEDGTVQIWNRTTGRQVAELKENQGKIYQVTFSPDGKRIATVGEDGTVELWNLSGRQLAEFRSHQAWIDQVTFSPDGQHLATVAKVKESIDLTIEGIGASTTKSKEPDITVKLWNLSGQPLAQLKGHQGYFVTVRFSPDGQRIATAGWDGTAKLWDLSGRQLAELKSQGEINDVKFSPNGEHLATVGTDDTVQFWDLSGKQLFQWKVAHNETDRVNSMRISFSPDGQRIAIAGKDHKVHIWDVSGQHLIELKGNQISVFEMSFSSDGQRITTLEYDKARVWDLSGHQLAEFDNAESFSPDGQFVATLEDGKVQLRRVRGLLDEQLAQGCDWLKDYFASHPEDLKDLKVCQNR